MRVYTLPAVGSKTWIREFKKALEVPSFSVRFREELNPNDWTPAAWENVQLAASLASGREAEQVEMFSAIVTTK